MDLCWSLPASPTQGSSAWKGGHEAAFPGGTESRGPPLALIRLAAVLQAQMHGAGAGMPARVSFLHTSPPPPAPLASASVWSGKTRQIVLGRFVGMVEDARLQNKFSLEILLSLRSLFSSQWNSLYARDDSPRMPLFN